MPKIPAYIAVIVACFFIFNCAHKELHIVSSNHDLIPRKDLFSNSEKTSLTISPDGRHLGFLGLDHGAMNIWMAPTTSPDQAKPLTSDNKAGIYFYRWAYDGRHVLYTQDNNGDENTHIFKLDFASKKVECAPLIRQRNRIVSAPAA